MKGNRIESFVAWLARVFKEDKSSDLAFGAAFGVFAFVMLTHTYSFFASLIGGFGLFAVIVIVLRLAVSSPRLTVVGGALVLVVMTVIGLGLSHLVK
jgi:hypothetical protein